MILVAVADQKGYAYNPEALNPDVLIPTYHQEGSSGYLSEYGVLSNDSIADLIATADVDGYCLALPNLPNTFMSNIARQFIASGWRGVLVKLLLRNSSSFQAQMISC